MSSIGAIIERQCRLWEMERRKKQEAGKSGQSLPTQLIITVSRQRGSRGSFLAEQLAQKLDRPLLHRELVDEICRTSGYRRQVIESLDNKMRSRIELWVDGLLKGQYVDSSDYFRYLLNVIRTLAVQGGVVVVGRGANFIISPSQGYHVRVIAGPEIRAANLVKYQGFTPAEAEKEVRDSDRIRSEFIRSHFKRDINDPQAYDLVVNTTHLDIETALEIIETGYKAKAAGLDLTRTAVE